MPRAPWFPDRPLSPKARQGSGRHRGRLPHLWTRLLGLAGIALSQIALWVTTGEDPVNPWVLHGGFLMLSLTLAAGAAELYRPRSGEAAVAQEELAVDPLTAR